MDNRKTSRVSIGNHDLINGVVLISRVLDAVFKALEIEPGNFTFRVVRYNEGPSIVINPTWDVAAILHEMLWYIDDPEIFVYPKSWVSTIPPCK